MLIATPYRDFDVRDKSPPRIISEIRKSCAGRQLIIANKSSCSKPKLSGDLLLKCGSEKTWWTRRVLIKGGQLHVCTAQDENGACLMPLRIPLRHLSLQAGPLPNSLSLCRGQTILLTLQTASERAFDEWVKIIAIELIRQTPLDAIKYLDILTIAECWRRNNHNFEKDWNYNNYITNLNNSCDTCNNDEDTIDSPTKLIETTIKEDEVVEIKEKEVENLLKKCQNVENYVPVKDKLFLFESLCKMGRKVRSTEDVSLKIDVGANKRARSMHDLTILNSHIAVREICKYFEKKSDQQQDKVVVAGKSARRLVFSDSHLNDLYKCRKVMTT